MKQSFRLEATFNVSPETLYNAWLDSTIHSEMTGGEANCSNVINGVFLAWDGYISGTNKSLIPNKEIVQSWRTTEFLESDNDSELIIQISKTEEGSLLTLIHNNIPEGQSDYEKGWIEHYFNPMKQYFQ
jgi:activator of HSP90 ATPase